MATTIERTNEVRALGYMVGVLWNQARDPLCRECKKMSATHLTLISHLTALKSLPDTGLDEAERMRLAAIEAALGSIALPKDPKAQRKIGACRLPGGECMVKHSRKMYKKILGIEDVERDGSSHG